MRRRMGFSMSPTIHGDAFTADGVSRSLDEAQVAMRDARAAVGAD